MNANSAVVFLVFNRPQTTERVLEEIFKAKPSKLLVVADGPRVNHLSDLENCAKVIEIIKQKKWECEVIYNISEKNMGCKKRVSSGLNWAFENVEEAIILEDDCLPDPSFFPFCNELLSKYRYDNNVMHIGGLNMQFGKVRGDGSYYFSKYNPIWGWASWRRAWRHYDVEMKTLSSFLEQNKISRIVSDPVIQKSWITSFRGVQDGKIDTWDFQWTYAIWSQGGICIIPNVNLISNIGFNPDSLHTKDTGSRFSNMKTQSLERILHPGSMVVNEDADKFVDHNFIKLSFFDRARNKVKKILSKRAINAL